MNDISTDIKTIKDFLGDERIECLKDYVVEKLQDNLEESIDDRYLVFPNDFTELWDELFESCKKEIIKRYKKTLTDVMSEKVEEYISKLKKG